MRFQAAGNRVIVGGRRTELLEQIATEHPGIETVVINTTDPDSLTANNSILTRYILNCEEPLKLNQKHSWATLAHDAVTALRVATASG